MMHETEGKTFCTNTLHNHLELTRVLGGEICEEVLEVRLFDSKGRIIGRPFDVLAQFLSICLELG